MVAAVGGVGVGLLLMVPLHWLRTHLKEPLLQNTLSLLIPFVAYAAAEHVHDASGVLAVVVVALYLGHRSWQVDFATRIQEHAVWRMVSFILESVVFALIGLQLPYVLRGLGPYGGGQAAWYALAVFVAVVVVRFVWVFPATYLPRFRDRLLHSPDRRTRRTVPGAEPRSVPHLHDRDPYRRLAGEMIAAERTVFVELRDRRRIDDEMLRTLMRRLDLEEAAAYRAESG